MKRRTGALAAATGLAAGDHVCWSYDRDDEHRRIVTAFLLDGLARGERIAYFGYQGSERHIQGYLADAGQDARTLEGDRRLLLGSARDAYTPDGRFDADDRLRDYRRLVEQAVEDGFTAFRVVAEAAWLLNDPDVRERWPAYELRADLLATEIPFVALCAYDLRVADLASVPAVASVHASTMNVPAARSTFHVHGTSDRAIAIGGEVDITCSEAVGALLSESAADLPSPVVDLSALRFADVTGVRSIAMAARAIAARGQTPRFRGASPMFEKLWRLMALDERAAAAFE